MYIIKERKWHLSCCCHDNSYAAGAVLIETKIPRFYLKQGSSTPSNLLARVKTIWEPCVFRAKHSVLLSKVANAGIKFFRERDWRQGCCHGNKIVGVVLFLLWCTLLVPSLKTIEYFGRYSLFSILLCGLHEVYSHIMASSDLFVCPRESSACHVI